MKIDLGKVGKAFKDFGDKIKELETIEKDLDSLDSNGFEAEVSEIKNKKFNSDGKIDLDRILEIKEAIEELKQKIDAKKEADSSNLNKPVVISEPSLKITRTIYDPIAGFQTSFPIQMENIYNHIQSIGKNRYWFVLCLKNDSQQYKNGARIEFEIEKDVEISSVFKERSRDEINLNPNNITVGSKVGFKKLLIDFTDVAIAPDKSERFYFKLETPHCNAKYTIRNGKVVIGAPEGEYYFKDTSFDYACSIPIVSETTDYTEYRRKLEYGNEAYQTLSYLEKVLVPYIEKSLKNKTIDTMQKVVEIERCCSERDVGGVYFNLKILLDRLSEEFKDKEELRELQNLIERLDVRYNSIFEKLKDEDETMVRNVCNLFVEKWKY